MMQNNTFTSTSVYRRINSATVITLISAFQPPKYTACKSCHYSNLLRFFKGYLKPNPYWA